MFKVTIPIAVVIAVIGAIAMGLTNLFWTPIFFFCLATSIALCSASFKIGGLGFSISLILYVIVYFVEPKWLQVLLEVI